jgi:hypothetical protein
MASVPQSQVSNPVGTASKNNLVIISSSCFCFSICNRQNCRICPIPISAPETTSVELFPKRGCSVCCARHGRGRESAPAFMEDQCPWRSEGVNCRGDDQLRRRWLNGLFGFGQRGSHQELIPDRFLTNQYQ